METAPREIVVNNGSLVRDVQEVFNVLYPYLKIEFFRDATGSLMIKEKDLKLDPDNVLQRFSAASIPQKTSISGQKTVAELTNDFKSNWGMRIKVLRKSGKVWNVISLTDDWTLEDQNKAGEFISNEMTPLQLND